MHQGISKENVTELEKDCNIPETLQMIRFGENGNSDTQIL